MLRPLLVVLFAVALAGCRSEEAELEQLQARAELADLRVDQAERDLAEAGEIAAGPAADSARARVRAARARATLARRDLERFLRE